MNTVLIDTMYIEAILCKDEPPFTDFADAIDDGNIVGISSTVSLTELIKNLGMKDPQEIAARAGELRLRYDIPPEYTRSGNHSVLENRI